MIADSNERIGPYRLIRRLGMGGMGEVFLAYDDRLDRPVAIKQVRRDALPDPTRPERFRREARSAARLSHPHIVRVYDILESDEGGDSIVMAIVMEYLPGRSIAEILRQDGPLPLPAAVTLARQIANGLAAAHTAGVVHRDLKGENVLVSLAEGGDGQAKILDFGLARPLDGSDATLTEPGAVLGTYRSMSPEQARGEPADARSDLFSLGVLLYEMLTGVSPFAGRTPLETLRRIDAEPPRPLTESRPDAPAELAALVDSLLAKEPARRPPDAARVARELQALAASSTAFGEAPTVAPAMVPLPRRPAMSRDAPEPTSPTGRIVRPQARRLALSLILLLALASAGTVLVERERLFRRAPLRVAVLRPSGPALAASGTLVAEVRGLLALDGITVIDPAQIGDFKGSPRDVARAVGADEVLTATVEEDEGGKGEERNGSVSLRRIHAADGAAVWAERVAVPTALENALLLANAVAAALRRAYRDFPVRPGTPDLEVRAEDYAGFINIKHRLDAGRDARAPEIDHLDAVLTGSPRFLDGHLAAASLAATLYQDTKRADYLARAHGSLERARALAPGFPPLFSVEIGLATVEGNWARAESALGTLERLVPGDPIVLVQRCRILQGRGDLAGATVRLRQLIAGRPTWTNLLWLADLETRQGQVAEARRDLEQSLALAPGNNWSLAKLAELELLYGNLRRAERIYRGLATTSPHRSDLTNLGLVRYLLGDYAGAVESYHRALAMDPGHRSVLLNLADAEAALGRTDEARQHYAEVLADLEKKAAHLPLEPVERTVQAQCLAHLGRGREAVALVLDTLAAHAAEPEVTYQAALVFALTGQSDSALALAKKAIRLGVQPRWLAAPGFERLRGDEAFRSLLPAGPAS